MKPTKITHDKVQNLIHRRLGRRFTLTGMSPITIAKVNYVWRITLLDTEQNTSSSLILKVGNPKWRVRKTRTEANVLTYLADHPEIKAPKLVAFDDQSEHSELGMEFILMQELSGVPLSSVWDTLPMDVKLNVIKQVAKIIGTLQRKTFDTIGNFSKTNVDEVGNLVPLEWQSPEEVARGAPVLMIGPVSSFGEYITTFINRHINLIESKSDEPIMPFIEAIKYFRDRYIIPHCQRGPEKFVFTHADISARNILASVTYNELNQAQSVTITGLVDWEWALSAPKEMEVCRLIRRWLLEDRDDPSRLISALWAALETEGYVKSPSHDERIDIIQIERLTSALESYRNWSTTEEGRTRARDSLLVELKTVLSKYGLWAAL